MGVTDRIRASLGGLVDGLTNPKRYAGGSDVNLDETTSPSTWRDETKESKIDWLKSRKRQALSLSFVLFYVILLLAAYSQQFAPGLYQNPWLIEALKFLFVIPLTFILTTNWMRGKLRRIDWVVMIMPAQPAENGSGGLKTKGGIGFYVGSLDEDSTGNTIFTPVKGFDFIGLRGRNLTLGDLGDDFARTFAKQGRQAEDDASIRLEDALSVRRDTFLGTVCGVLTGGLELDEFARESDLYTTPPDLVDQERYRDLSHSLEKVHEQNQQLEGQIDVMKEQRGHWKQQAKKGRDEYIEEFVEEHGELAESGFGPRGRGGYRRGGPADYGLDEEED